jgi:hypothetical protein
MTEILRCLDHLYRLKSDPTLYVLRFEESLGSQSLVVSSLHDARPTVDSENDNQRSYAKPVKSSLVGLRLEAWTYCPTPNVRLAIVSNLHSSPPPLRRQSTIDNMTTFQAQASCIQLTAMPQLAEVCTYTMMWFDLDTHPAIGVKRARRLDGHQRCRSAETGAD